MDSDSGAQRQNYGKGASKQKESKSLDMIHAGGKSDASGPTGSASRYPKGSKVSMSADFNPMNCKPSTYGINGV